jgi:hypothetical protein
MGPTLSIPPSSVTESSVSVVSPTTMLSPSSGTTPSIVILSYSVMEKKAVPRPVSLDSNSLITIVPSIGSPNSSLLPSKFMEALQVIGSLPTLKHTRLNVPAARKESLPPGKVIGPPNKVAVPWTSITSPCVMLPTPDITTVIVVSVTSSSFTCVKVSNCSTPDTPTCSTPQCQISNKLNTTVPERMMPGTTGGITNGISWFWRFKKPSSGTTMSSGGSSTELMFMMSAPETV